MPFLQGGKGPEKLCSLLPGITQLVKNDEWFVEIQNQAYCVLGHVLTTNSRLPQRVPPGLILTPLVPCSPYSNTCPLAMS